MKKLKRILVLMVSLAMLITVLVQPALVGAFVSDNKIVENLGVLKGDDSGVSPAYLAAKSTRLQSAIISLRLSGNEAKALAFKGTANFTDASQVTWTGGRNILAYLKANPKLGWVGYPDGSFKPNSNIDAQAMHKVLLETLGYKQGVDFAWAQVISFAKSKGFSKAVSVSSFINSNIASTLVEALKLKSKGSDVILAEDLIPMGVISYGKAIANGFSIVKMPLVTIHWQNCAVANEVKEKALVEAALAPYLIEKINATLKLDIIDYGEYVNKTQPMIASGEELDIVFQGPWTNLDQNVARGAFVNLAPYISKYMPKTFSPEITSPIVIKGNMTVDGKLWVIPEKDGAPANNGLFYRKDIAEKYKIDMSKYHSLWEIDPALELVKEGEDFFPIFSFASPSDQISSSSLMDPIVDPIGDNDSPGKVLVDGSTKVVNQYALPAYRLALLKLRDWVLKGYTNPDMADKTNYKTEGKWFCHAAALSPYVDLRQSLMYGQPHGMVSFQKVLLVSSGSVKDANNTISITSKNPERAMMIIELANTDDFVNNTINFGVEGKHYVKVSKNIIDFPAGITRANTGFFQNYVPVFFQTKIGYLWTTDPPDLKAKNQAFNDTGVPGALLGFTLDAEPIKTELAAIATVLAKYLTQLNAGIVDVDVELPKLLNALKDAGSEKIVAEKQRQVDAWLVAMKK